MFLWRSEHLVASTRALGVDFIARLRAACRETEAQRLEEAKQRCDRIVDLPCGACFKAQLVASIVTVKAVQTAWTKLVPTRKLNAHVQRTAGSKHPAMSGSVLQRLRCFQLPCCPSSRTALAQQISKTYLAGNRLRLACLMAGTALPPAHNRRETDRPRESWCCKRSAQTSRTPRLKFLRSPFHTRDTHGLVLMTGPVASDARLHRILQEDMQPCAWCDSGDAATWDHAA